MIENGLKSPSKNFGFICFYESPLKSMKKLFSFLKYLFFCSEVFDHVRKQLD